MARDGQGSTTSRNAEETQQQSELNRAPRTNAMHPKCPRAAHQLVVPCDVLMPRGTPYFGAASCEHPSHDLALYYIRWLKGGAAAARFQHNHRKLARAPAWPRFCWFNWGVRALYAAFEGGFWLPAVHQASTDLNKPRRPHFGRPGGTGHCYY